MFLQHLHRDMYRTDCSSQHEKWTFANSITIAFPDTADTGDGWRNHSAVTLLGSPRIKAKATAQLTPCIPSEQKAFSNKSYSVRKKELLHQMCRQQRRDTGNMKKQASGTPAKGHNSAPGTDRYLKESYDVPGKEFKIRILRKFNQMQGDPVQRNEENNVWYGWDVQQRDRNHWEESAGDSGTENLGQWNKKYFNNRTDQVEERIPKLKDKTF